MSDMFKQVEPYIPRSDVPNDARLNVALPSELERRVDQAAHENNTYKAEIVRRALYLYFDRFYHADVNTITKASV